ncbi:hypothetical protein [Nakamurella lactea]|uniref:hypothetical protein n=1 Tax=Nakamurella lactea TaxID=459515 RepID=UPI0004155455|nr:hypothetical protein [Nakamurella lactea]
MSAPGQRHPLAFGRRPPTHAPALTLAPMLTGVVPPAPAHVDYGRIFTGWKMLGNDVAGDCVAVTWANQRALVTAALTGTPRYPDQSKVWSFYRTQNPDFNPNGGAANGPGSAADNGMVIQTALDRLRTVGGPDGVKAVAFAQVDYTNERELRAAHAIFGQVWYGITVLDANEQEFWSDEPWDYHPDSPIDAGHSVTGVGYDPTDYQFITWAIQTRWTESFRTHLVDEAWVVIWPEHFGTTQFQQGIDVAQLAADFQAITGEPLPVPPPVTPACSVVSWGPDRLDAFVRGSDRKLWHQWWNGSRWGRFESLGGTMIDPPTACSWAAGRLDVFARGADNTVRHQWFDGTKWGSWQSLGGNLSAPPAVVSWGPRRLDLFGLGTDNAVWYQWFDGTKWGSWQSLGGNLVAPPVAACWGPRRLDLFGLGADSAVWHQWFDGTKWGHWQSLGGNLTAPPAVVSWGPRRLDLFGLGADNAVWHQWFDGTKWGHWQSLGGNLTAPPAVVSWGPRRLDLFGLGTDRTVRHQWFDGTKWGHWQNLGGNLTRPPTAVASRANRLDVFGEAAGSGLAHRHWDGTGWGDWENLGGDIS